MIDDKFSEIHEEALANFTNVLKSDLQFFTLCLSIAHFCANEGNQTPIINNEALEAAKTTRATLKAINESLLKQIKEYESKGVN